MLPRPAATLALVRDGHAGLEVYLLVRNAHLEFAGGATVFPGGAVDDSDCDPALWDHCRGHDELSASRALGLPPGGLGYWLAAIRECLEEVGVLLAVGPDGSPLPAHEPDTAARIHAFRAAILNEDATLHDLCVNLGVALDVGSMRYFGHWITPPFAPRRYDTRFFVAPLPPGQEPEPDRGELVSGRWMRPADALAEFADSAIELIVPTEVTIDVLARFDDVAGLLAALDRWSGSTVATVEDRMGRRAAVLTADSTRPRWGPSSREHHDGR